MAINELAEVVHVPQDKGGLGTSRIEHLYITLAMRLRESKADKH